MATSEYRWRKSSYCMNESDCVEIARVHPDAIGLRDSKRGAAAPALTFSGSGFRALVDRIRDGEFDPVYML